MREHYSAKKNNVVNWQVGKTKEYYSRGVLESLNCVPDDLFLKLGHGLRVCDISYTSLYV